MKPSFALQHTSLQTLVRLTCLVLLSLSIFSFFTTDASAQTLNFGNTTGGADTGVIGGSADLGFGNNAGNGGARTLNFGDNVGNANTGVIGGSADLGFGDSTVNGDTIDGTSNTEVSTANTNPSSDPPRKPDDPQAAQRDFAGLMYSLMTSIGGFFTWIGGGMLDYSVALLVVDMGNLLNGNIGFAINNLWTVIRDIFNLLFIFALIWIGLQTILDADDSKLKKTLGSLIVAALLINFSLFITKAVVDFSNIAAVQIYDAGFSLSDKKQNIDVSTAIGLDEDTLPAYQTAVGYSISTAFMQNLELNTFATELGATGSSWRIITYGFLVMITQMIAAFVFLAGGILLIYRFIALILYMIFSPVMFLGLIFPKFLQYQDKWWKGLLSNSFVAPAYLFMLYLSLTIFVGVQGGKDALEVETFAGAYTATAIFDGGFSTFLFFGVMIGFLLAAPKVATEMGAAGAKTVTKVGTAGANTLLGWGKGAVGATSSFAYRNSVGRGAEAVTNKFDTGINKGWKSRSLGERAAITAARVAGGSNSAAGRRKLEGAQNTSILGGRSRKNVKEDEKYLKGLGTAQKKAKEQKDYQSQVTALSNADLADRSEGTTETIKQAATALDNLTKEEIGKIKVEILSDEKVAIHLTDKHMDKLKESGSFSDGDLEEIKKKRKKAFAAAAAGTGAWANYRDDRGRTYAERVLSRDKAEVAKLPEQFFTNRPAIEHLSPRLLKAKLETAPGDQFISDSRESLNQYLQELAQDAAGNDELKAREARAKLKQWRKWSTDDQEGIRYGLRIPKINGVKKQRADQQATVEENEMYRNTFNSDNDN